MLMLPKMRMAIQWMMAACCFAAVTSQIMAGDGQASINVIDQVFFPALWSSPTMNVSNFGVIVSPATPTFGDPTAVGVSMNVAKTATTRTVYQPVAERLMVAKLEKVDLSLAFVKVERTADAKAPLIVAEVGMGAHKGLRRCALGESIKIGGRRYRIEEVRTDERREVGSEKNEEKSAVILRRDDGTEVVLRLGERLDGAFQTVFFRDRFNNKAFTAPSPGILTINNEKMVPIESYEVIVGADGLVTLQAPDGKIFVMAKAKK